MCLVGGEQFNTQSHCHDGLLVIIGRKGAMKFYMATHIPAKSICVRTSRMFAGEVCLLGGGCRLYALVQTLFHLM